MSSSALRRGGRAQAAEDRTLNFTLRNGRAGPLEEVVRVSLPVPAGLIRGEAPRFVFRGDERIPAQADIVTRHPDGSIRRMILSFPVRLGAQSTTQFVCEPGAGTVSTRALAEADPKTANIQTDLFDLHVRDDSLQITGKSGKPLGAIRPFGPAITGARAPTLAVVENGPFFVWLRWRQDGSDYSREVDIEADKSGRVRLVQRILRHLKGNGWTPDFGFELSAAGAVPLRFPAQPVRFLAFPAAQPLGKHAALVAALKLADGTPLSMANPLALRQHRGSLDGNRSGETTTVRFSRIQPVARESNNLLLQEGMWRTLEVLLQPGPPEDLAAAIDTPVAARADWRLFDSVYHTGPPLEVKHPVLKAMVTSYVTALQGLSLNGDDWGSLGGLERYNHCQYLWEDFFRSGDSRLRRIALDYSENYNNISVNWGPNPDFYGGGRYPADGRTQPWPGSFRTRHNDAVTFCTKGYHGFWLAYEETGDPRFRYAAQQQAKWSAAHVQATVNYTRCIGQVIDFVKLYEYTGDKSYLNQAVRLWSEFQACQNPDLLFNEAGVLSTGNESLRSRRPLRVQAPVRQVLHHAVCHQRPALPARPPAARQAIARHDRCLQRLDGQGADRRRRMVLSRPDHGRIPVDDRVLPRPDDGLRRGAQTGLPRRGAAGVAGHCGPVSGARCNPRRRDSLGISRREDRRRPWPDVSAGERPRSHRRFHGRARHVRRRARSGRVSASFASRLSALPIRGFPIHKG